MSSDSSSESALKAFPFYTVDGVANFREIGGYQTSTDSSPAPSTVRKGRIFRSGELTYIKPSGAETLQSLGIRKVFDLRADVEIKDFNAAPVDLKSVGINVERIGIPEEWPDAETLGKRLDWFNEKTVEAFTAMYTKILKDFYPSFAKVFRYIKDHPDDGVLVHCTSGKDRSGVFSALLLKLLGVSDSDVAHDYSLTTIGLEPFLPILAARFKDKPVFKDHWEGSLKLGSSLPESMLAFLEELRKIYGSAEEYLLNEAGLSKDELASVKKTMLTPALAN